MLLQQARDGWRAPWSATKAIAIDYGVVGADEFWQAGPEPNFQSRDLGLAAASGGLIEAVHRRAVGKRAGAGAWQCHDVDFQFLYVLKGAMTIENEHGGRHSLGAGAVALHGPFLRYVAREMSDDLEVIEIRAPAHGDTIIGRDAPLPEGHATRAAASQARYLHESPDSFVVGAGPRRYFAYRDLGTAAFTGRRIHIHVVKALAPMPGGTGWHNHTMSQLFAPLEGWAQIVVDGHGERRMNAGDAMCLNAGMRHDVPAYSANYKVLEMCIPADYDTTATAAPA